MRASRPCRATSGNELLWSAVRSPFPLPHCVEASHTCQWEVFDSGKAGCLLCGVIHICGQHCTNLIEGEDAEVCSVTGVCVRSLHVSGVFEDTVLFCGVSRSMTSNDNESLVLERISGYVNELIASDNAMKVQAMQFDKFTSSFAKVMDEAQRETGSFFDSFVLAWKATQSKRVQHAMLVGIEERQRVAKICAEHVYSIIVSCASKFRLNVKTHELRNTVFGLMYLMRNGLVFRRLCVIPMIAELRDMLPRENMLDKHFNFKTRYITDLENKCKYLFRIQTPSQIDMSKFRFSLDQHASA